MRYSNYLVHFNKNHSSKDGKFTYGDGDGDGIVDDHRHGKSNRVKASTKSTANKSSKTSVKKSSTQKEVDTANAEQHGRDWYEKELAAGVGSMVGGFLMNRVGKSIASMDGPIALGVGATMYFGGISLAVLGIKKTAVGAYGMHTSS